MIVALVAFLSVIAVTAVYAVLNGFVLSTLWGWFAVPIFGLPALGIAQGIGIAMIITWLTYRPLSKDDQEKAEKDALAHPVKTVLDPVIRASAALIIGWILTLFI